MEKITRFEANSVKGYLDQYVHELTKGLLAIPPETLQEARDMIQEARVIYIAGNGGSLAISEHWVCDFMKSQGKAVVPLTSAPILSAIANDLSYQDVFSFQLERLKPKPEDLLILISASGNSENVLRAARFARDNFIPVLGLTGFSGGALSRLCSVNLHIPVKNYGIVEDAHQALMHVLAQF